MTDSDDRLNNLLAAGGLCGVLWQHDEVKVDVVTDGEGNATNQLRIEFGFLKSPYIVTVERLETEIP